MNPLLDPLRQDQMLFDELLQSRRAVSMETLPIGARVLWTAYLTILEDAVKTLRTLIDYLGRK